MLRLCVWTGLALSAAWAAEFRSHTSVEIFADDAGLDCQRGQVVRASRVSGGRASLECADPPPLHCPGGVSFTGTAGFNRAASRGPTCLRNSLAAKGRCGLDKAYVSKVGGPLHSRHSAGLSSCCQLIGAAHDESCRNVIVAPRGGGRFRKGPGKSSFEAVKAIRSLGGGRVMLTICELHCPPPPVRALGKLICFPGESTVNTPTGPKAMHQLRLGDEVSAMGENGMGFCPITALHHADAGASGRYLELSTSSGHQLRISHQHLIFSPPTGCQGLTAPTTNFDGGAFRFASRLVEGDCLLVRHEDGSVAYANVTKIDEVEAAGVFAPITSCGTVVVDGVLASSYASFESQSAMHTFASFAHSLSSLFSAKEATAGIPGPLQLVLSLARLAVPAMSA